MYFAVEFSIQMTHVRRLCANLLAPRFDRTFVRYGLSCYFVLICALIDASLITSGFCKKINHYLVNTRTFIITNAVVGYPVCGNQGIVSDRERNAFFAHHVVN